LPAVAVLRSSSGGVAIRYALPVLWMTNGPYGAHDTPEEGGATGSGVLIILKLQAYNKSNESSTSLIADWGKSGNVTSKGVGVADNTV